MPVLLLYGKKYLGAKAQVKVLDAWVSFIKDQSLITEVALGDGVGHFVAEEAADETADALLEMDPENQGLRLPVFDQRVQIYEKNSERR